MHGEASAGIPTEERNETKISSQHLSIAGQLDEKSHVWSFALTGLFVLAVFYTMYFMRAILLPLVLALLLSYLLVPLVRVLAKSRLPPPLGAAIVLLGLMGAIGYGVSFLSEPAAAWIEKAPYSLHQLQQKLL